MGTGILRWKAEGNWVTITVEMKDAPPIDYPHVHRLYAWAISPKGGGWFVLPTSLFAVLCLASIGLYIAFKHWSLLAAAGLLYGSYQKRLGIKEGFVLGYESGHDEAFEGKHDFKSS